MHKFVSVRRMDKLGAVLTIGGGLAVSLLPFIYVKANRIVAGKPFSLISFLSQPIVLLLLALLVVTGLSIAFLRQNLPRVVIATVTLTVLLVAIGMVSASVAHIDSPSERITPGGAFWILLAVLALAISDALTRLRLKPWMRILALCFYTMILLSCLTLGILDTLSIMKEFDRKQDVFWTQAQSHLLLAFGALSIAIVIGLPLGITCFWKPGLRAAILRVLSLVQTIPSLALFGLLMVPLGYFAAHSTLAAAIGIRGIGAAPALIALVLYSLLPIVANTVVGLNGVDPAVRDAAAGMGLTRRQILTGIDLPLAFPVILTGIRIVLVQAIGLVAVAALIGGGGFGVFIFQGLSQTAMDLVLLGALPTVFLAFASAIILDAVSDSFKVKKHDND